MCYQCPSQMKHLHSKTIEPVFQENLWRSDGKDCLCLLCFVFKHWNRAEDWRRNMQIPSSLPMGMLRIKSKKCLSEGALGPLYGIWPNPEPFLWYLKQPIAEPVKESIKKLLLLL